MKYCPKVQPEKPGKMPPGLKVLSQGQRLTIMFLYSEAEISLQMAIILLLHLHRKTLVRIAALVWILSQTLLPRLFMFCIRGCYQVLKVLFLGAEPTN